MLGRLTKGLLGGKGAANDTTRAASFMERFDREFAPRLGVRADSLRLMLALLAERSQVGGPPALIIETGSVRQAGNWLGDGQSTVLWGDFASRFDAEVHTVDLDPAPARRILDDLGLGEAVQVHGGDSVAFLHDFAVREPRRRIDLLYLDSYDLDIHNPYPSALHHLMELAAARPCLGPGSIVAIDDNPELDTGGHVGKGMLVGDWFNKIGIPPLFTGYQFIWRL
jgi:Methyltransferase domain